MDVVIIMGINRVKRRYRYPHPYTPTPHPPSKTRLAWVNLMKTDWTVLKTTQTDLLLQSSAFYYRVFCSILIQSKIDSPRFFEYKSVCLFQLSLFSNRSFNRNRAQRWTSPTRSWRFFSWELERSWSWCLFPTPILLLLILWLATRERKKVDSKNRRIYVWYLWRH